jgi:phthiocerol/phenolphthiocerol synthesis type-I polyketide synthase E
MNSTAEILLRTLPGYAVCPICKSGLGPDVSCGVCGLSFPVEEGTPVLIGEKAAALAALPGKGLCDDKGMQVGFYTTVGRYLAQVSGDLGYAQSFNYLNFGYSSNEKPDCCKVTLPVQLVNKNSVKLTLEVIGDVDITGKAVVEVGCGRGGNLMTMREYLRPRQLTGVDLCTYSINYCQTHHPADIDFLVGDAEQLPLASGRTDVVFNLESSHAYPARERFYQEVYRILKPGGYFLYSDSLPVAEHFMSASYLQELGFEVIQDRDITSNVLLSCDKIALTRETALKGIIQAAEQKALGDFVATPDSDVYRNMSSGKWLYKILQLIKIA